MKYVHKCYFLASLRLGFTVWNPFWQQKTIVILISMRKSSLLGSIMYWNHSLYWTTPIFFISSNWRGICIPLKLLAFDIIMRQFFFHNRGMNYVLQDMFDRYGRLRFKHANLFNNQSFLGAVETFLLYVKGFFVLLRSTTSTSKPSN